MDMTDIPKLKEIKEKIKSSRYYAMKFVDDLIAEIEKGEKEMADYFEKKEKTNG